MLVGFLKFQQDREGRDFSYRLNQISRSHNSATVSAFIMNIFIAELNVFGFSSGPRQRNK